MFIMLSNREVIKMMTTNECVIYDMMVELGVATAEELNLARNLVSGSWEEVLNAVCYVRTGYHTFEQYLAAEMEEEEGWGMVVF